MRLTKRASAAIAFSMMAALPGQAYAAATPVELGERCSTLTGLRLEDTVVTEASVVPAKAPQVSAVGRAPGYSSFCRVVARVRSEPDSDIGVEIWLPLENWAGVFHGNGNGGFAGQLSSGYAGMADGLRRGFATAVTDTGTAPATPTQGDALIGQPRKWRDWGRLSTHVMTVTGKAITKSFYGRAADKSLYTGCSTGGQQGLIEALYYPADYDGILVGAPVIDRTWGHAAVLWDYASAYRSPDATLSADKLRLLNRAAIAACWKQGHGIAGDPFINDPMACKFDPQELVCKGGDSGQCLTDGEIRTARDFYSGPRSSDGKASYYGWLPGSEIPGLFGWSFLQTPIDKEPPFASLFKWVFGADWRWQDFDFDRDMPVVEARLDDIVNDATRGSLAEFARRGGKLIVYHGLADTLVAPGQSVDFFERQSREIGQATLENSTRLYLAPGMMHCGGGTGPDSFNASLGIPPKPPADDARHDLFNALIEWTEGESAPESIVATKYDAVEPTMIDMQRPLCPYPKKARYLGSGSTRASANFVCEG
ncbi:tannase/feruloyl esterase family alpha/beta hydrolase [Altererythrobacter sp. CAU 1778]